MTEYVDWGLKQQTLLLTAWRREVRGQGAGRCSFWEGSLPGLQTGTWSLVFLQCTVKTEKEKERLLVFLPLLVGTAILSD